VFVLAMVIVGGMDNIWGVIVGAIALSMMNRYGLPQLNDLSGPLGFDVTAISFGIFGFFLLIMMVLRPEGLIPSGRRRLELHEAEIEGVEEAGAVGDFDQAYEVRQA
jgi:branched-chain amino acid transport system permease protein